MKKAGIYRIISPSGSVYIGQSKDVAHRFYRYRTAQCKRQPHLYASICKYGGDDHEYHIIHELPLDTDRTKMDLLEQSYIKEYKDCGFKMMNLNEGGKTNKELSPETRKKLSESAKGKKYWLGRKHTDEAKDKIRIANTGVVFTEERLQRMSDSNKGKPSGNKGKKFSEETRLKISNARKGIKISEEQKAKVSAKLKGRIFTEEHKLKLREAWLRIKNETSKSLSC